MKKKFNVSGMMCAACQANVDRAVKKVEGVKEVNVSLLASNMVVDYDESLTNDEAIIAAVTQSGYGASIFVNESVAAIKKKRKEELRKRLIRLLVSIGLLILLMIVSMGGMFAMDYWSWPAMDDPNYLAILFWQATLQIVFLIPIVILNFFYFTSGFKSLFKGHPNMNSLVALGSTISIAYSLYQYGLLIYAWANGDHMVGMLAIENLYFESAAMILVFVSIGKYFEKKATNKTTESIVEMLAMTPETAYVLKNGKEVEVPTENLVVGDIVSVKPGMTIPTDGTIIDGYGNIDESALTGEAMPVYRSEGEKVIGATINKNGSFLFQVSEVGKDTTMSKIVSLVEQASESKAPIARLADKISCIFIPAVIAIAVVVFSVWMILTNTGVVEVASDTTALSMSLRFGITVLVISCPCALGLATPVAIMVGTGKGAESGILIKSAEAFEAMEKVGYVLFDKTGTLTTGEMNVVGVKIYEGSEDEILLDVASIEAKSEHPLSQAIVNLAKEKGLKFKASSEFEYIPGQGVKGKGYSIGNLLMMKEAGVSVGEAEADFDFYSNQGATPLFVSKEGKLVALIAVGDQVKKNTLTAIRTLQSLGKKVAIVTGDNKKTANYVAKLLGVDEVFSEVLPGDKQQIVEKLQQKGMVAFVGDGVNDAPALTKADVGIAIGAGTDVAIDSADIVLVKNDPLDVVTAIELSHKVVVNIKENLTWAFLYNIILIPLAAGVAYPYVEMKPMYGSIAMSLSSIFVCLNALRLRLFKIKTVKEKENEGGPQQN